MAHRDCIECNRPLFDQSTPDDSNLCDYCYAESDAFGEDRKVELDEDYL